MAFRKFNKVEKTDILPRKQVNAISDTLRRLGKKSMSDLTEEERKELGKKLDK
jgi:hypothetical protein